MRHARLGCTALLLCSLASGAAWGQHQSYNLPAAVPLEQVTQLEAQRRALFQKIQDNPSDIDAGFAYAVLSTRLGDYEAAIATYERLLVLRPATPRLQLELAALYFRLGAYAPARQLFEQVKARPGTPAEVKRRVEGYLVAMDAAGGRVRGGFSARVSVGARYDSNANAAPDGSTINLNGIDFELSPDSRAASDTSGQVGAQVRYRRPIARNGDSFDMSLAASSNRYRQLDRLDSDVAELRLGPDFSLNRWGIHDGHLTVAAGFAQSWLDGGRYMHATALTAGFRKPVGREAAMAIGLERRDETYTPGAAYASARGFSGQRYRGTFTYTRQMGDDWQWMLSPALERLAARTAYNAYWEPQLNLGFGYRYPALVGDGSKPWTLMLSSQVSRRRNDAPMPVVSRSEKQRGNEWLLQAVQTIPLRGKRELQVYAGYRRVTSNYDLRDYASGFAGFSISQNF